MLQPFETNPEFEREVRDSFEKEMGKQQRDGNARTVQADWLESPVGTLLAVADATHLHLLSFLQKAAMERRVALTLDHLDARLELGTNAVVDGLRAEMDAYFAGSLRDFATPIHLAGTDFQIKVWELLRTIPFGHSLCYTAIAEKLGKPAAFRAVAQAAGQNPIHIVVPCHRAINRSGGLGGYAGGVERKRWLLEFEKDVLERSG